MSLTRLGAAGRHKGFSFTTGNLVLIKWEDGMVYFAKIKRIDRKREKCTVVFDDKSQDEADFCQIHSVDETTTDIICIKCKKDNSDSPNEIVLCDMCGIGFHQKCHTPPIPASALQLDIPWKCSYCQRGIKCPFITESLDVLQNLLSDDNETTTGDEEDGPMDSEYEEQRKEEPSPNRHREKRKYRKRHYSRSAMHERRKSLRLYTHSSNSSEVSGLVTSERKSHQETGEEGDNSSTSFTLSGSDGSSSRKRKRHHTVNLQKRSSVESRTVSVTRISTPIYDDASMNFIPILTEKDSTQKLSPVFSTTDLVTKKGCIDERSSSLSASPVKEKPPKAKQREFRVSLSLPEEIGRRITSEKSPGIKSPLLSSSSIPSCDETTPKTSVRSPSFESDSCFPSPGSVQNNSTVPFLASPLPTTSKKTLTGRTKERVRKKSPSTKDTHVVEQVSVLKSPISSPASMNTPVSKTLDCSYHMSMSNSHSESPDTSVTVKDDAHQTPMDFGTDSSTHPVMVTSSKLGAAVCDGNPAKPSNPSATRPVMIASLDSAVGDGRVATGSGQSCSVYITPNQVVVSVPDSKVDVGVTDPAVITSLPSHNLNIDVGVTGSMNLSSVSSQSTNPVVISTIEVNSTEVMDSAAITECQKKPAILSPVPLSSQLEVCSMQQLPPATSSPPVASQASSSPTNFTGSVTKEEPPASGNSSPVACVKSPVKPVTVVTSQQKPADLPATRAPEPPAQLVAATPAKKHRVAVREKVLACTSSDTVKTEASKEHCEGDGSPSKPRPSALLVEKQPLLKPAGKAAGAPTPVITKTPPQIRGHPPTDHQKIVKSDKPTTNLVKEQLPVVDDSSDKQLETQASGGQSGGKAGDPDVIITGVEPSGGNSKERTNKSKETPTTNSLGSSNAPPPKQVGSQRLPVVPAPSLHASERSEKPSYYYQVQTVVSRPEKLARVSQPLPARTLPNTMHVLYSGDPTSRPVLQHGCAESVYVQQGTAGTHHYHAPVQSEAIRVGKSSPHPSTVVTTKPYAIVNAIPAQPSDVGYRPIAVPQKPSATGEGRPGGHHVVQMVPTAGPPTQQLVLSQHTGHTPGVTSLTPGSSLPPPPSYSTYIAGKQTPKEVSKEEVQSIQKKIGDAFTHSSEGMLVSAFEEAWNKFQDNDKAYNRKGTANKEVVIGTSKANLVQQMSTKPRVIAPKPLPENTRIIPTSRGQQYIHVAPPTATQQIMIPADYTNMYAIPAPTPGNNHQIRVAGLYYPSVEGVDQSDSHKVVMTKQHVSSTAPKSQAHRVVVQEKHGLLASRGGGSQPQLTSKAIQAGPRQESGSAASSSKQHKKICAWCGGNAIYLCSGCHLEWYCGSDCQLKSWELHSDRCNSV